MLQNGILLVTICYVSGQSYLTKKPLLLKLTPEQIMQTFDGVMSDDYIKVLAKDFAAKAAAHFMKEIRYQKDALIAKLNHEREEEKYRVPLKQHKERKTENINVQIEESDNERVKRDKTKLNEQEALRLLQDPSPDGDHLESSGEFSDKEKKSIPVIQVTKINGVYYRRLLGMI